MVKVALARNTGQDLCKLLGVERLTFHQQLIASALALELMEAEVAPSELMLAALTGPVTKVRIGD